MTLANRAVKRRRGGEWVGGGSPTPPGFVEFVKLLGPRVYWRLGEASGVTTADASPNGRDGTYVGSPTLGATGLLHGSGDTAVTFDGTDDRVTRAHDTWLNLSTTGLTVIALAHPTSVTGQRPLVSKWDDASYPSNAEWFLDCNGTTARMVLQGTSVLGVASASGVANNTTQFFAGTIEGLTARVRFYNASGLVGSGSGSATGAWPNRTEPLLVGALENGAGILGAYQGRIDEVAVFPGAMPAYLLDRLAGLALTGTPF